MRARNVADSRPLPVGVVVPKSDDDVRAALYEMLRKELAGTTVISIGHRSTLTAFHDRTIALKREGSEHRLIEGKTAPAAG